MKVRRYSNIYGKKDYTWLKILITFVVIALVVFVAFSVADPIAKLFSGDSSDTSGNTSDFSVDVSYTDSISSVESTSSGATESQDTISSTSSQDEVVVRPERTEYTTGLSVTLSLDVIRNAEKFDVFLQSAEEQNVKNVIIELKDEEGYIYYNTANKNAKNCGAINKKAVSNLKSIIAKLRENNIAVTAKIHCFSDRLATDIKDAAVKYQGENGGKWLDETKENGGKSWLNPYSDTATNYLLSIVKELTDMGVDNILLASVRFPGGHQKYAYYGYDSETVSRSDCLARFVKKVKEQVAYAGSEVWLEADNNHYLGKEPEIYGENIFVFGADCVVANIVADDFDKAVFINNVTISDPHENYRDLIRAVMGRCQSINEGDATIIPMLQGYNYENEEVKDQIKEAKKYGATRYILEIKAETLPNVR